MSATGAAGPALLLVDDGTLRRAALAQLLEHWAEETGLAIAAAAPPPPAPAEPPGEVRLALLGIGGALAEAPEVLRAIEGFARRFPAAAVVVVSDRGGTADVVAAIAAGARGVITADTDPAVVLGALRFLLGGGTVFPP